MTIDFRLFHVATKRAGEYDSYSGDASLSSVHHDSKVYYYDLSGLNVTVGEFGAFLRNAFEREEIAVTAEAPTVYRAYID